MSHAIQNAPTTNAAESRVWIVSERAAGYEAEVQFFYLCRDKALGKLAELVERDCTDVERQRHARQVASAEARGAGSWRAISVEVGNRHEGIESDDMTFLTLHAQPLHV